MVDGLMGLFSALSSDISFWAALVFFILSLAGSSWILRSLYKKSVHDEVEDTVFTPPDISNPPPENPFLVKTVRIDPSQAAAQNQPATVSSTPKPVPFERLAEQVTQIEDTLSKIEKKMNEQNTDQLNEIAGQLKLIMQMLKMMGQGSGGGTTGELGEKVDKIYKILSTFSSTEQK